MQVAKWGNSLAIRLPRQVVDLLELKAGDDIEITVAGRRALDVARDPARAEALAYLRSLKVTLPPGFTFSREEANER